MNREDESTEGLSKDLGTAKVCWDSGAGSGAGVGS